MVPVQLVLYDTDAVHVEYSDGSALDLSPCGSGFQHYVPVDKDSHPLLGKRPV